MNTAVMQNFYSTLNEFLGKLNLDFPELKINTYRIIYDNLPKDISTIELVMAGVEPYGLYIMQKDANFFLKSSFENEAENFATSLGLRNIWLQKANETQKEVIWKYIQTLYILGMTSTGKKEILMEILKNK